MRLRRVAACATSSRVLWRAKISVNGKLTARGIIADMYDCCTRPADSCAHELSPPSRPFADDQLDSYAKLSVNVRSSNAASKWKADGMKMTPSEPCAELLDESKSPGATCSRRTSSCAVPRSR